MTTLGTDPSAIVLDDTTVYYLATDESAMTSSGAIFAVAKPGD